MGIGSGEQSPKEQPKEQKPSRYLTPEQKDKIDAQKLAAEKARRAREFQENLKAAINLSRLRQIREVVDNAEKK